MFVGICGKAGSGKDTVAHYISDYLKCGIYHWADPIKEMLISYFGLTYEDAYSQSGKAAFNDFWGMTNREILQRFGTDACRNGFREDVWIKIMELKLKDFTDDIVLLPDTRFDNEAKFIVDSGGFNILVVRDSLDDVSDSHSSEAGVSDSLIKKVIYNNSDLVALLVTVQEFCKEVF